MLEQLKTIWGNLVPRQRLALAVAAVATVIGLIVVAAWSSRPAYSVLYNGLAQEDAAAIVGELRSAKVPYRLAANGGSIEVPTPSLYETRLNLAAKGMPSHSIIGFELFDRSGLPGTDFSNNVNLQRALQGELSRTICSLSAVKSARVHLSMPRESLYADATPPTASVLLDLGADGSVRPDQVRGIARLVASAVDKLSFQNVTVMDTLGNVLFGSGQVGNDLADSTLGTSKAFSEALTARLQTMLDSMFGAHRTIVRAQADLDMDAEETSEERMEPAAQDRAAAVSKEHTTQETYSGARSTTGGVSGVPANVLGGAAAATAERDGTYRSTDQTREYEFSKKTTRRTRHPGRVTRVTVAAVVDESLAGQGVDRVREVLEAAAGVDTTRGDTVVVRPMKLKAAELADKEEKLAQIAEVSLQRQATIDVLVRRGLPALVILILLAVVIRTAGDFRRAAGGTGYQGPTADTSEFEEEEVAPDLSTMSHDDPRYQALAADEEEREEEELLAEELRRFAREQPEVLAEELRNLVSAQDNL